MGNLFDRKNDPDTEVAVTSEYDKSMSKVNLICQLRICFVVFVNYKHHNQFNA